MKQNSLLKNGYNQEEAYFHKEGQRLIEKQRRAKLSLVRNDHSQEDEAKKPSSNVGNAPSQALKKAA